MAFEYKRGTEPLKSRIEAMDWNGSTLCYGDHKGFLYLHQLQITATDFLCKELTTVRASKSRVDRIEILRVSGLVLVLTDGKLLLLDPSTLEVRKVLVKSGVTMFAASATDFVAVAMGKKLHFFACDPASKQFLPFGDKKVKEILLPEPVIKMSINST